MKMFPHPWMNSSWNWSLTHSEEDEVDENLKSCLWRDSLTFEVRSRRKAAVEVLTTASSAPVSDSLSSCKSEKRGVRLKLTEEINLLHLGRLWSPTTSSKWNQRAERTQSRTLKWRSLHRFLRPCWSRLDGWMDLMVQLSCEDGFTAFHGRPQRGLQWRGLQQSGQRLMGHFTSWGSRSDLQIRCCLWDTRNHNSSDLPQLWGGRGGRGWGGGGGEGGGEEGRVEGDDDLTLRHIDTEAPVQLQWGSNLWPLKTYTYALL